MRIAEIYKPMQGEEFLNRTESVFVRTSGCNLRCWYCDTPYTSWEPEGDDCSVDDILKQVAEFDIRHVVLTGGEPMLFAELIPLCRGLRERHLHITIETAGTLHLPLECDLMSISPKLSNSAPAVASFPKWHARHEATRHRPEVIRRLVADHDYQIKFVVDQPGDCDEIAEYLRDLSFLDRRRVLLMPQGTDPAGIQEITSWLEPYCRDHELQFCPRRHLEWFGFSPAT